MTKVQQRFDNEITGLLVYGKPAGLICEGREVVVAEFLASVYRFKWRGICERWQEKATVQDVGAWRCFTNFVKAETMEARRLLEGTGHLDWWEGTFGHAKTHQSCNPYYDRKVRPPPCGADPAGLERSLAGEK